MLTIWTKTAPAKVLKILSPVLKSVPDLPVAVVDDYSVPQGTTAILALGSEALKKLQEEKLIAKNRTTTSYRTLPQMRGGVPVLVSYSPDIGDIDHGYYVDLLTDVSLAIRYCLTEKWTPVYGTYSYVQDFSGLCSSIEAEHTVTQSLVDVSMDLETLGLDPYALPSIAPPYPGAYIVSAQATNKKSKADVIRFADRGHEIERLQDPAFREQMEFLLRCPYVRLKGANFKYDLHWLWKRGGFTCSTFTFDTTIVGSLLDENRSNGLDVHVKIYVPSLAGYSDRFDREVDKERMDKVPPDQLLPYAGGDVDGDLQVAETMKRELLSDPQLTSFYVNILHPAARAFEQVEQGGIVVDKNAYQELKSDLEQEHARLVKDACKIMGGRIVVKHGDPSKPGGMNLTKASMLTDFMFSPMGLRLKPKMFTEKPDKDGIQRPSTALEHLEMFADVPEAKEFIEIIRQDSAVVKALQTYVVGFLEHLRSDGRYHPSYWLFVGNKEEGEGGARTGRLSCTAPAFQCMVGDTVVTTEIGPCRLDWLVDHGHGLRVLTHTGRWQAITHTYRNGVQPVFRVRLSTGQVIDCTANHQVLTTRGWIRTDCLQIGDVGYVLSAWPHRKESQSQPNVRVVDGYETTVYQSHVGGVAQVRSQGDRALPTLVEVSKFSGRHGREAGEGVVDRTEGQQGPLRTGQLCVGNSEAASQQQEQQSFGNAQRSYQHVGRVGEAGRDHSWVSCLPFEQGDGLGSSLNESEAVQRQVFSESIIVRIEALGERETFDLTIENSHSFVANGIAVHNTVPKHTKWAKRIRRCFPAPPGYVVVERDYGQGELRVIACIAHEANMIAVFKSGKDIHADTAAPFAGFTYEALMALEKTDLHKFEETRQLGKAGNFGLVFGMKEDGFIAYAKGNYGVDLTWDEAHDFREGFFQKYPNLLVYHEQYKRIAREQKMVRTPLGRIRHLPLIKSPNREVAAKAERQAINSPVQGCLTDMVLWTIALEHKSGLSTIAPCFGACHDSILNYVPEDKVDEIVTKQLDQMEALPFEKVGWKPQLKFVADAKVGKNWGEVQKFVRT